MNEERRFNPFDPAMHKNVERRQSGAWMIIFTDLLSLMLAFFVLLFSMKQIQLDSWRSLVEGLSERLNPANEWTDPGKTASKTIGRVEIRRAADLGYLQAVMDEKSANVEQLIGLSLHLLDDRLVISLPADMLFDSASAVMLESANEATNTLASTLNRVGNRIDIVGYSDPQPITNKATFQSNWDLSLARAVAVANAFGAAGYNQQLRIVGRGDSQYYDLSDKLSFEQRMRLARRVDIIVREGRSDEVGG